MTAIKLPVRVKQVLHVRTGSNPAVVDADGWYVSLKPSPPR